MASVPPPPPPPPPAIQLTQLNHVTRVVKDLDRAAAFYRDLLGFREIPRPPFRVQGRWLHHGTYAIRCERVRACRSRAPTRRGGVPRGEGGRGACVHPQRR